MTQIVSISHPTNSTEIIMGEHALAYQSRLSLSSDELNTVVVEACDILSHCTPVGVAGGITNLAVGYVQSGKTMSFTMLTALAADNGYKVIIYLTGTKLNLQDQTSERLKKDLDLLNLDNNKYVMLDTLDVRRMKAFLKYEESVLLIPIMKHPKHISDLATLLKDSSISPLLADKGVLIIDDEADQASLNTFAFKNSKKEDWENSELSKTYEAISELKKNIPSHSYIQYTATPQSLLLIDEHDILSPTYHTVLTPGKGYTGGKYFFKEHKDEHVRPIPDDEVDTNKNRLTECPESLVEALQFFVLSLIYKVIINNDEPYLSMMVHIDGQQETNEKYHTWINEYLSDWLDIYDDPVGRKQLIAEFSTAYSDLSQTVCELPSLANLFDHFEKALLFTQTHLLQSGAENNVNWHECKGHILVGANMLNRGFTIERLSTTFMPRTNKSTANADTIEQRCRFFGYKKNYIDVCRIYLSDKALDEFTQYVEHEEILRNTLKSCNTLSEYKSIAETLILSNLLKPTRQNVLSKKYVRENLAGWKQFRTADFTTNNLQLLKDFATQYADEFQLSKIYDSEARNHRYVDLSIDESINWLSQFASYDAILRDRKASTIQYLKYIQGINPEYKVRFYHMSYQQVRERKLDHEDKPINMQIGHSPNWSYPGDANFKLDDVITIQLYHVKIKDPQLRIKYNNKETCNLAIHYPEGVSFSYVEF